ncbi:MAG TPA: hypothetical protein P5077_07670, partial [bacterium]|nr:hypothetical protein [bacterium]
LLLLSSNFDRAYDYGRVSAYDLEQRKVVSSLLVGSLGGRMLLVDQEERLYVSTREENRIHRIALMRDPQGLPWLVYDGDGTLDGASRGTRKEPYAMATAEDDSILLVSHLRGGEVMAILRGGAEGDIEAGTFDTDPGVTDIILDDLHRVFLTVHRSAGLIGLLRLTARDDLSVSFALSRLPLPLPSVGVDIRDITASLVEPSAYYLTYRNREADTGTETPMVLKTKLVGTEGGFALEHQWSTALAGELGESAIVPCGVSEEYLFTASPNGKSVSVIEATSGTVVGKVLLDDCSPYQLFSRADDPKKRLFVGCFSQSRVVVLKADCAADDFMTVSETIP